MTCQVEELAEMLAVELGNVQAAVSVACRLHFAHRLPRPGGEANLQEAGTEKSGSDLDPIPLPGVKGSTICTGDPPSLEDVEVLPSDARVERDAYLTMLL